MKHLYTILATAALAGCLPINGGNSTNTILNAQLVVAATSPDYSTSDIAVIGPDKDGEVKVVEQVIDTTDPSDIRVSVFGGEIYRIGRFGFDSISKFDYNSDTSGFNLDWQFSVLGDDSSANPYDILVISDTSAYVTRYAASSLWHVNPSAKKPEDFLLSEIDLSPFANATNGISNMADLELIDDQLFVLLVGLDADLGASDNSYIAVIDTLNNTVVDTNLDTAGIQAINLGVRNASNFEKRNGTLFIAAVGDAYNYTDDTYKYSGGIVSLNPENFETELLIDDGDNTEAPYGNITNVAVSESGDIFFTGSAAWGKDKLFVKASGETAISEISLGTNTYNIGDLAIANDTLYIGVHSQTDGSESAGLKTVSLSDNQLSGIIPMTYNPSQIVVAGTF
jgi:hypothetical protein